MLGFSCVLFVTMREAFKIVNERMDTYVRLHKYGFADWASDFNMWPLMAHHRLVTQMVNLSSDVLGLYFVSFICFNLGFGCFLLYMLFFFCSNGMISTLVVGWSFCNFGPAIICQVFAAQLHVEVSSHAHVLDLCSKRF